MDPSVCKCLKFRERLCICVIRFVQGRFVLRTFCRRYAHIVQLSVMKNSRDSTSLLHWLNTKSCMSCSHWFSSEAQHARLYRTNIYRCGCWLCKNCGGLNILSPFIILTSSLYHPLSLSIPAKGFLVSPVNSAVKSVSAESSPSFLQSPTDKCILVGIRFEVKQESSAKLTNQRVSYAFISSPLSFHPVIFCLLPSSSIVILVFYLFSTVYA